MDNQEEFGISRRKLLAILGSAGVAVAAGGLLAGGRFEEQQIHAASECGEPIYNVCHYGAIGDGTTNDTAAIQSAISAAAAGGGMVFFPPGLYMVHRLTGASSVVLQGSGAGNSTIKARQPLADDFISFHTLAGFSIRDLTFDMDNVSISGNQAALGIAFSSKFEVAHCRFINFTKFGLGMVACYNFAIQHNRFEFQTALASQNQAINISEFAGECYDGDVSFNECARSAINISGRNMRLCNNVIHDFKFGGGITTEQAANSKQYIIRDNVIYNGTGTDVNNTNCPGIENWGPLSVITGNIIYGNSGAGIDQGGQKSTVANNIVFNNGVTGGPGISSRYSPQYNASESVYVNNVCFDTNGASGTQTYGIQDQSSSLHGIQMANNMLANNKLGPMSILSPTASFLGPRLHAKHLWTPGAVAADSSVEAEVTVAGAKLGDFVEASATFNLEGWMLFGWVKSANLARLRLVNQTSTSKDPGTVQINLAIVKPANHEPY